MEKEQTAFGGRNHSFRLENRRIAPLSDLLGYQSAISPSWTGKTTASDTTVHTNPAWTKKDSIFQK